MYGAPLDTYETIEASAIQNSLINASMFHVNEFTTNLDKWKKEIYMQLNDQQKTVFSFLEITDSKEPAVSRASSFVEKFGNTRPIQMQDTNYIKTLSGRGIDELNAYIRKLDAEYSEEMILERWKKIKESLLTYMKSLGQELIQIDFALQTDCKQLDSFITKAKELIEFGNPGVEGYDTMIQTVIAKQFETKNIEASYWNFIYTLQKYTILRDLLFVDGIKKEGPTCCVCMEEPSTTVFVPCGHTFCSSCSKKKIMCHVCRSPIQNTLRIYFT
jgi:hypothetical protein